MSAKRDMPYFLSEVRRIVLPPAGDQDETHFPTLVDGLHRRVHRFPGCRRSPRGDLLLQVLRTQGGVGGEPDGERLPATSRRAVDGAPCAVRGRRKERLHVQMVRENGVGHLVADLFQVPAPPERPRRWAARTGPVASTERIAPPPRRSKP